MKRIKQIESKLSSGGFVEIYSPYMTSRFYNPVRTLEVEYNWWTSKWFCHKIELDLRVCMTCPINPYNPRNTP